MMLKLKNKNTRKYVGCARIEISFGVVDEDYESWIDTVGLDDIKQYYRDDVLKRPELLSNSYYKYYMHSEIYIMYTCF